MTGSELMAVMTALVQLENGTLESLHLTPKWEKELWDTLTTNTVHPLNSYFWISVEGIAARQLQLQHLGLHGFSVLDMPRLGSLFV